MLTKPLPPPKDTFSVHANHDKLVLSWEKPLGRGHAFLDSYKILLKSAVGGCLLLTKTVPCQQTSLTIEDKIASGREYNVSVASVCKDINKNGTADLESVSTFVEKTVVTPPKPPPLPALMIKV